MEASKIKVGQDYAYTRRPKYHYGSIKVTVLQSLALSVPSYGKYAAESRWAKEYEASPVDTYQGKSHYLVQDEDGRKRICSSLFLVKTWAAYEEANGEALKLRAEREAKAKALTARVEAVEARLEELGFDVGEVASYGGQDKLVVPLDIIETLVVNALGGEA